MQYTVRPTKFPSATEPLPGLIRDSNQSRQETVTRRDVTLASATPTNYLRLSRECIRSWKTDRMTTDGHQEVLAIAQPLELPFEKPHHPHQRIWQPREHQVQSYVLWYKVVVRLCTPWYCSYAPRYKPSSTSTEDLSSTLGGGSIFSSSDNHSS